MPCDRSLKDSQSITCSQRGEGRRGGAPAELPPQIFWLCYSSRETQALLSWGGGQAGARLLLMAELLGEAQRLMGGRGGITSVPPEDSMHKSPIGIHFAPPFRVREAQGGCHLSPSEECWGEQLGQMRRGFGFVKLPSFLLFLPPPPSGLLPGPPIWKCLEVAPRAERRAERALDTKL